jgi:hypothetical protein
MERDQPRGADAGDGRTSVTGVERIAAKREFRKERQTAYDDLVISGSTRRRHERRSCRG